MLIALCVAPHADPTSSIHMSSSHGDSYFGARCSSQSPPRAVRLLARSIGASREHPCRGDSPDRVGLDQIGPFREDMALGILRRTRVVDGSFYSRFAEWPDGCMMSVVPHVTARLGLHDCTEFMGFDASIYPRATPRATSRGVIATARPGPCDAMSAWNTLVGGNYPGPREGLIPFGND